MCSINIKSVFILVLFVVAPVFVYAQTKSQCLKQEDDDNVKAIIYCRDKAPDYDKCIEANTVRHAAQIKYCNTLE
jgi:hypothetical protein